MSFIETVKLQKFYNKDKPNECRALDGVSISIEEGELVAVIGKSGSGKTTLAHLLACIIEPTGGVISVGGKEIQNFSAAERAEYRNKMVGVVFQDFFLINELSAVDNVLLPTALSKNKDAKAEALALLDRVGLSDKATEKVGNLSGGEKQRVAIARALINKPKIIIADEPSGNLDTANRDEIIGDLLEINKSGTTVIIVTHDKEVAALCGKVIELSDGKVVNAAD